MSDKVVARSSGGGIGFCGALAILFIALKLFNQITWSWWWVLSPLWLPICIVIGVIVAVFGLMYIVANKRFW